MRIGQNGGFLGHVMVALSCMERVGRSSADAAVLRGVGVSPDSVWRLSTMECTRSEVGLHKTVIFVKQHDNKLTLMAEIQPGDSSSVGVFDAEDHVEAWQSPPELRSALRRELMAQALAEMAELDCSWSLLTAARALLTSSKLTSIEDDELLEEIQDGWTSSPICTTIAIAFWQRYLCKLAAVTGQSAAALVRRWMPIRADAVLPGDLLSTIQACGWAKAQV